MKRIVILGGLGRFGSAAAGRLRAMGLAVLTASRRSGGDLRIDAEDPGSLRRSLAPGDVVVDAAGPFQRRSMALVEAALSIGFDLVDLNDDLSYARSILAMKPLIERSGIRVLSSASSVSALSTALVRLSGIAEPRRIRGMIVPAARHTANPGSAAALLAGVGRPVSVLRERRMQMRPGWRQRWQLRMPQPLGRVSGHLVESADLLYLPGIWPMLSDLAIYIDTNTPGVNRLLDLAAGSAPLRRVIEKRIRLGTWIARQIGREASGLGYEIEGAGGQTVRVAVVARTGGFLAAVAPAVLAVRSIAEGQFSGQGLVPPDRQVDPTRLFAFLREHGVRVTRAEGAG